MVQLKSFYIKGLNKDKNISIDFESNVKIIVAENGAGKTTVMNAIYAFLTNDYTRLSKIDCDEMGGSLDDGQIFKFSKSHTLESVLGGRKLLDGLVKRIGVERTNHIERIITESIFDGSFDFNDLLHRSILPFLEGSGDLDNSSIHLVHKILIEIYQKRDSGILRDNFLSGDFDFKVVYLPTYRRVENNFKELYGEEKYKHNNLMNFGMSDVEKNIEEITKKIKASSLNGFSKVSGGMLNAFTSGYEITDQMNSSLKQQDSVKIVLDRIGSNVGESNKRIIFELLNNNEIFLDEHKPLRYFLAKLVALYNEQKSLDLAIKKFSDVCNRYLNEKKVFYDESLVTIKIVRNKDNLELDMAKLSSGEKQIISLFSRLYLQDPEDNSKYWIFFDEPELSLSIEWQENLIPDIIESGKCAFLFATTHSPFIFKNKDVVNYVSDLRNHTTEI